MPPGRGLLVTSGTLHQQPGLFFHLIQSELGDLYKVRARAGISCSFDSLYEYPWRPMRAQLLQVSLHRSTLCKQPVVHTIIHSEKLHDLLTKFAFIKAPATEGFVADVVSCVYSGSRQVSLVVNAEQTEVTDISIEVRERLIDPLHILLK